MDHYQTLNVPATASAEEIRKAFRKLAMQFHPDRNSEPGARARFEAIQHAWLILKDRRSRAAYNYSRYTQSRIRSSRPLAMHITDILHASTALQKKLHMLDPFRLDLDLLLFEINDILSPHNRSILLASDDQESRRKVFRQVLAALRLLPLPMTKNILPVLIELSLNDRFLKKEREEWLRQVQWQYFWNRYKILIALGIAVLFCLLLYLS